MGIQNKNNGKENPSAGRGAGKSTVAQRKFNPTQTSNPNARQYPVSRNKSKENRGARSKKSAPHKVSNIERVWNALADFNNSKRAEIILSVALEETAGRKAIAQKTGLSQNAVSRVFEAIIDKNEMTAVLNGHPLTPSKAAKISEYFTQSSRPANPRAGVSRVREAAIEQKKAKPRQNAGTKRKPGSKTDITQALVTLAQTGNIQSFQRATGQYSPGTVAEHLRHAASNGQREDFVQAYPHLEKIDSEFVKRPLRDPAVRKALELSA